MKDRQKEKEREGESGSVDHERIRLVIPSSLRLLNFPPFHPLPPPSPSSLSTVPRQRLWRRAPKRRTQAGSRLHKITRMPSHLFSCHHGCSRDIKRQFKDDWTMTHDTPAIGQDGRFPFSSLSLFPLSFLLSLSVSFAFLSLPRRRRQLEKNLPVDIGQNMPVSVAVGTCTNDAAIAILGEP